ncbi:MAG: tetraacyldisaccharide 4'-kinase [Fuerstiella sp.]
MREQIFRRIISGQTQGIAASCVRGLLWLLQWPYAVAILVRNLMFDRGWRPQITVDVPVIAIGNLTTGGTGKTPVVAWVVQQLQQLGLQPGIASRGYAADSSGVNDEKRVLELLCPGVPHEQNPNRVAAAQKLIRESNVTVIVLDDAFQHRRIARNLNIVLIDATSPFGYEAMLPRGLLREPVSSLQRADLVLVTRADAADEQKLSRIEFRVCQVCPALDGHVHRIRFAPTGLVSSGGVSRPAQTNKDVRAVVMTGIGNPEAFVKTCQESGFQVAATRFFPDHHHYTRKDLEETQQLAKNAAASLILTTLKDLVKIPAAEDNLCAVQIQTVFQSASDEQKVRDELVCATKMNCRGR